jgi:hypothetical protein
MGGGVVDPGPGTIVAESVTDLDAVVGPVSPDLVCVELEHLELIEDVITDACDVRFDPRTDRRLDVVGIFFRRLRGQELEEVPRADGRVDLGEVE